MTDEELRRLFEALRTENAEAHAKTREYVDQSAAETRRIIRTENAEAHATTREYVDQSAAETWRILRTENAEAHATTREYVDQSAAETRRELHITAEGLRGDIRLLAEVVGQLEEKRDREIGELHEKMDRGFADTQAMIRFSHAELDRRVRALEQAFADLQSRVERLETTTH